MLSQEAFDDMAQSYTDIITRGGFLPGRNIERDIAEADYGREANLMDREQDVSNTEIDDWYNPER